jgi:hypothetical protein
MGSSKNSSRFFRDEQVSKSGFSRGFPRCLGDPKILETQISLQFLEILKDGLVQNYSELGLPQIFLGILKGRMHPKK